MTKHTPGPWKIDRYHPSRNPFGISRDTGNAMDNKSVINSGGFARRSTDEAEANARLIAAAPDLLDGLNRARAWMVENKPMEKSAAWSYYVDDLTVIDAAIKKATHCE